MRSLIVLLSLFASLACADELKPVYIELSEQSQGQWQLLWKVSARSMLAREGRIELPTNCEAHAGIERVRKQDSLLQFQRLSCDGPLWGQDITLHGLEHSNTDALVRVKALADELVSLRLTSRKPGAQIALPTDTVVGNVAWAYTVLGVEHILFGLDHLLFVVLMVLLISGWQRIAWAVTAFTVAHSITLIGATLGLLGVSQNPVEAVIALSIMFMALEVIKLRNGKPRLVGRYPWLLAFAFGLLHGFGFAGALSEIGLPETDIPLALLSFNLGVEVGQLLIVVVTLMVLMTLRRFSGQITQGVKIGSAYLIGTTATIWFIERLLV